ncbi:glycosyltransferase family 2 protein [Candidatus Woesearchaeota archaeon]|nr:glycosyltransferase family 2 protein [Candidatus Woesearchaeota archaeon]
MEGNIIMICSSFIFALLFLFLLSVFITSIASLFQKKENSNYEPKISVVIPCYNEEKNIGNCLNAVYASDYPLKKIEVIVVDDGSTDKTVQTIEEYKKKYSNIKIIRADHKGKSEALNRGIKKASYDIILTVDADTNIDKITLKKLVQPFVNEKVGATNGSCIARNKNSLLGLFQNIEYHYNNLIRKSFSVLFNNGIWFYGAFACYKKEILKKIGYFKKDSMTEDADIALEIYAAGYKTINVHDAVGHVLVPSSLKAFIKQRTRWWIGVLQALKKNKNLFSRKSSPSILFLFINQYWWSFYSLVSFPIIAYQFYYWLPNISIYPIFGYTFRWFSLAGPLYVLYNIPKGWLSLYNIFGILSGIISALLITKALYIFKEGFRLKNIIGIFFYFPYTIILNTIIVISLLSMVLFRKRYFIY